MSHGLLQLEKAQSRELFLTLLNIEEGDEAMDAFDRQRNKETAKTARRALKKRKKFIDVDEDGVKRMNINLNPHTRRINRGEM